MKTTIIIIIIIITTIIVIIMIPLSKENKNIGKSLLATHADGLSGLVSTLNNIYLRRVC